MSSRISGGADRILVDAGLCRSCRHAELKTTARSVFLLCRLSDIDSRFSKYPQLPVSECSGVEGSSAATNAAGRGC